jgi:hypothetical protein
LRFVRSGTISVGRSASTSLRTLSIFRDSGNRE